MSDMAEDFSALRKVRKEKKAYNRSNSAVMLAGVGVKFETKNNGAHLIVACGDQLIDFWPGTGLWRPRAGGEGRGVRQLLAYLSKFGRGNG